MNRRSLLTSLMVAVLLVVALYLLPHFFVDQSSGERAVIQNTMRHIIKEILIDDRDTEGLFSSKWANTSGYSFPIDNGKKCFSANEIMHPYGGRYVFYGFNKDNTPKQKYMAEVRVLIDIYDWINKGDKNVSVGFADGHIKTFPAPKTSPSEIDIMAILSKKGGEAL